MTGDRRVVEVEAPATHELRRVVLRTGTPATSVEFDADVLASTLHLAVETREIDPRSLLAVSTWIERSLPGDPAAASGRQLRGMATAPQHRGEGLGSMLLDAGIERCRRDGFDHVWANARHSALGFYLRRGFEVVGDPFDDADTGLPHVRIVRPLR